MIIRTITAFQDLTIHNYKDRVLAFSKFLEFAKEKFIAAGHQVQTVRISSQIFDSIVEELPKEKYLDFLKEFNDFCEKNGITFISPGTLRIEPKFMELINLVPEIITVAPRLNFSLKVDRENTVHFEDCMLAARLIKQSSEVNAQNNFNFAAAARCEADIPFFPASYSTQPEASFAIGIQLPTEANKIVKEHKDKSTEELLEILKRELTVELQKIEKMAYEVQTEYKFKYLGIDTSLAPLAKDEDSTGALIESLLKDKMGRYGTLSICASLTKLIKNLDVKKIGLCGLMLPVLEDGILAKRFTEGEIDVQKLLFYSCVCATGLDCVPLSGKVTEEEISKIIFDMANLAVRLNKPLTARLMPIPNKNIGEMTEFDSPYLVNTKIV